MAHIESFEIEGLAGRQSTVSQVLDRHINVFWGLNGSGKTSLLKILHSSLENDPTSLENVPFETASVLIRSGERLIRRRYDASAHRMDSPDLEPSFEEVTDNSWRDPEPQNTDGWRTEILEGPDGPKDRIRFRHSYLPISRVSQTRSPAGMNTWRSSVSRDLIDDAAFDQIFADQVRRRWQMYSNNALSSIREIQQQGLASILAVLFGGAYGIDITTDQDIVPEEAFSLVRTFLGEQRIELTVGRNEFIKRYKDETDLRKVVANIQDVTRDVEKALKPQAEFQSIIEDLYSGEKHLMLGVRPTSMRNALRIEIDGKDIPIHSLSSGEKQLLQLLLEILAAESNTVMIDEPELSMHVDWQQKLVASMVRVNPNCQLLLATHSPEVMVDVAGDKVFEL